MAPMGSGFSIMLAVYGSIPLSLICKRAALFKHGIDSITNNKVKYENMHSDVCEFMTRPMGHAAVYFSELHGGRFSVALRT